MNTLPNIVDESLRWIARLELEATTGGVESSRYEARLGQLRELVQLDRMAPFILDPQVKLTAELMASQLARWLGAFANRDLTPDDRRPLFPLNEIDRFTRELLQLLRARHPSLLSALGLFAQFPPSRLFPGGLTTQGAPAGQPTQRIKAEE